MKRLIILLLTFISSVAAMASEADLVIPELSPRQNNLLMMGFVVCMIGIVFGMIVFFKIKRMAAHPAMLEVSSVIFETCKTYLLQQGKFIVVLFVVIGSIIGFYFGFLQGYLLSQVVLILIWTMIGILGSYSVAWFGIRMNTYANSRMAFASLERKPVKLLNIPLDAGMSIGVMLVCVELIMMLIILLFVPRDMAGAAFIGFAIGESLGASALRIAGGIFTKIADIGSDLMKIYFKIKEDDPRNPGVIADCAGDNAGDSVGPTADGFETYGVTGVALISFIVLAVGQSMPESDKIIYQSTFLTWIFSIRILMVITSIGSFHINKQFTKLFHDKKEDIDFEEPLTMLVWLTSLISIVVTFISSYFLIGNLPGHLWITLSTIISCGTFGAALIPEITKLFTSPKSIHVTETVAASREGGASLNILSGLVAGNFSAFWLGLVFATLMFISYIVSGYIPPNLMVYPSIFAFGLVAFGFLGMGPVTIAVDSYGPVTDNAQSIYELSLIEKIPNIEADIEAEYGFKPDFEKAKHYLEANDGAGNTFKATAKPVLIGTAVVGATTMIFSLILIIQKKIGVQPELILSLLNPYTIMGFVAGGSVVYWFTGASIQAVTAGAYRAVEYIRDHINLDPDADARASVETSKEVVRICTNYAHAGMINIFIAIFSFALALAFFSAPSGSAVKGATEGNMAVSFFVSYLISLAVFGLFQAIFMANAGGCWDNTKKVCEVDLKEKGTPLHDATVVGDTVGDPFKDTSAVALNPIIKFTTLFGLLAMEIAINEEFRAIAPYVGVVFLVIALVFVYRSFYRMRIVKN